MKISIKYPKKKFIEAENISDLQKILKKLMIEEFDIKDQSEKPLKDILINVKTIDITEDAFSILVDKNSVIVPSDIKQCEI